MILRDAAGGAAKERPLRTDSVSIWMLACRPRADLPHVNAESGMSAATLLVCVTCKSDAGPLGAGLFDALGERLCAPTDFALRAIECLSVCKRQCTVALAAPANGPMCRRSHAQIAYRRHRDRRAPIRCLTRRNCSLAGTAALVPQRRRLAHAAAGDRSSNLARLSDEGFRMLAKTPVTIVTGFLGAGTRP